jgi:hypothetical protein
MSRQKNANLRRAPAWRPRVEWLEDRRLLSGLGTVPLAALVPQLDQVDAQVAARLSLGETSNLSADVSAGAAGTTTSVSLVGPSRGATVRVQPGGSGTGGLALVTSGGSITLEATRPSADRPLETGVAIKALVENGPIPNQVGVAGLADPGAWANGEPMVGPELLVASPVTVPADSASPGFIPPWLFRLSQPTPATGALSVADSAADPSDPLPAAATVPRPPTPRELEPGFSGNLHGALDTAAVIPEAGDFLDTFYPFDFDQVRQAAKSFLDAVLWREPGSWMTWLACLSTAAAAALACEIAWRRARRPWAAEGTGLGGTWFPDSIQPLPPDVS